MQRNILEKTHQRLYGEIVVDDEQNHTCETHKRQIKGDEGWICIS